MTVAAAWISDNWIYSPLPEQNAKYWIDDGRIWGPDGGGSLYWIADGWIWGPLGAQETNTGFYIRSGWIYGPRHRLPFAD